MPGLPLPLYRWFYGILLTVCPVFFFFYGLGAFGLLNNNEGLYGEIAREMLGASFEDWIIPKLNGVSYIEKPPLLYWLTALSFKIFGISEWSARFVPACSGVITSLGVIYFLNRLQIQRIIFPSILMLSSCLGYVIFSRMLFFEGLLTAFISLALLSFYLWWKKDSPVWIRLSYFFVGAASLTKGLVAPALLLCCVVVFFALERSSIERIKKFFDPIGIGLFVVIFAPWPFLAQLYDSHFFSFYFINEHILRFLDMREPRDYYRGPFYYYLPRILGYVFPWTPFLGFLFLKSKEENQEFRSLKRFLKVWVLVPLLFYSASKAKANYYMIISIVPFVLLMCFKIEDLLRENHENFVRGALGVATCLALSMLLAPLFFKSPLIFSFSFLGIFIGGAIFFFSRIFSKKIHLNWIVIYGVFISGMVLLFLLKDVQNLEKDPKITLKKMAQNLKGKKLRSVYFYKNFEEMSSFVFYLERPVILIDSVSADLFYASSDPQFQKSFVKSKDLTLGEDDYIVVHQKSKEEFEKTPLKNQTQEVNKGPDIFIYEKFSL